MNAQTLHLQEQARTAYKRKDYAKALELFDRAIGRSGTVQLHDNRAACYERLNDLPGALKDAKRTINLSKEDPTGYARAGRVLVKMDRKKVALEIYAHGLRSVKHVGQGFEMLRKVHLELMAELSPKSIDPLTVLPRELAEQILGYLNFRQVVRVSRVSKEWAGFIRSTPNLWSHLDLRHHGRERVTNKFVSRAINIGRGKLKAATLSHLINFDKALAALVRCCPLEEVDLRYTGLPSDSIVGSLKSLNTLKSLRIGTQTQMSRKVFADIVQNAATTLETLSIDDGSAMSGFHLMSFADYNLPNMQNFDLAWSKIWPGGIILMNKISNIMPQLRSLKLHHLTIAASVRTPSLIVDLSGLAQLAHVDLLIDLEKANNLILPPSVKTLAVGTWRPQHSKFFDGFAPDRPLHWHLPLLEDLRICAHEVPFDSFEQALRAQKTADGEAPALLHTLSMTASEVQGFLTKESLSHPRLAELKHLSLEWCHGTNDDHLTLVASTLPKLQSINLSGTDVTGAGIKLLVNNGLKTLVANDCRLIYHDAIQWVRAQGVQVEHKSTDNMSGGKKIRY